MKQHSSFNMKQKVTIFLVMEKVSPQKASWRNKGGREYEGARVREAITKTKH